MRNLLKIVFIIDALITLAFGLYSFMAPMETYVTVLSIPETQNELILSILSSLSVFYIFIGLVALIGAFSKAPTVFWIALLMLSRHVILGIMKTMDIGSDWLIGNPYPDIIIHSSFVTFYLIGMYLFMRNRTAKA